MKGKVTRYFVLFSFVLLVTIVAVMGLRGVHASEDDSEEKTRQPDGPLVVPIYPMFREKTEEDTHKLPEGADFRDSYIVLEDGSVMSVADWILGSLTKNDTGLGMSDYQNRLFLGQVARSMVGMDEDLINRSLTHSGPAIPYREGNPLPAPLEILKGLKNMLFPEMPRNWSPATSGGGFTRSQWQEGHAAILFERQMSEAMQWNSGELWESGTMQNMLRDYKKGMKPEFGDSQDAGTTPDSTPKQPD